MACPFIDDGHPKCEQMLCVDELLYVLSVCGNDDFEQCPIYQEQLVERSEAERSEPVCRRCV